MAESNSQIVEEYKIPAYRLKLSGLQLVVLLKACPQRVLVGRPLRLGL